MMTIETNELASEKERKRSETVNLCGSHGECGGIQTRQPRKRMRLRWIMIGASLAVAPHFRM